MTETWQTLPVCKEYEASDLGRIRRVQDQYILSQCVDRQGYCRVAIKRKAIRVHRLIATTFLSNPESKHDVNHINGIKTDNKLINLEWATRSENIKHAFRTGLSSNKGVKSPCYKITPAVVAFVRFLRAEGFTYKQTAGLAEIHEATIARIMTGKHFNAKVARELH